MEDKRELIIEMLENNLLYDYIARYYWLFTNDELKDILLEYIYILESNMTIYLNDDDKKKIKKELLHNIKEII